MQNDAEVQTIFNAVIASGIYPKETFFMCIALRCAASAGVISREDAYVANNTINAYLADNGKEEPSYTLLDFLGHGDMYDVGQGTITFCLPIYKDWKNRPLGKNDESL